MASSLASRLAWCPQPNKEIGLSPAASLRCNFRQKVRLRATEERAPATEEVKPPAIESKDTSSDSSDISKKVSVPEGGKLPTEATKKKQSKEDSGTAQVSFAMALVLGLAYLAVVALLESRGSKMEPPPPEAFLP